MNPDTGAIGFFETPEDAKKAGHTVPLTREETRVLLGVPRPDRTAELRNLRKHKRSRLRKERAKARRKG